MKLLNRIGRTFISKKGFRWLVFLVIFIFTFILRAHNYDRTPGIGHMEELLYGWSGIYLVETGVPVSWSTLNYPKRAEVFKGIKTLDGAAPKVAVDLYKPWLDEPPVFSLIVGYSAHLFGANRENVLPSSYIRFPVIFLAAITSIMIFLVGRLVSGYWIGILAMLVYGVTPIMVFASRYAVAENMIALMLIIVLFLLLKYIQTLKSTYLFAIPLLAGIAGLSKPTGFFLLPLALFAVFLNFSDKSQRKKIIKNILILILGTIPFIGMFFWYGLHFDSEIFWSITNIQSYRPVGFSSLAFFFTTPAFDISIFTDSWYVFCLLASVYYIFIPKKDRLENFLVLAFVYWVIIVMISGGEADLLPWYRFPAFPILSIIGAWGLILLIKKADFFTSFMAVGMLLGSRFLLINAFRSNIQPLEYRYTFSLLMIPSLLNLVFNKAALQKISKVIIIGVIVVGVYFNTLYIYNNFDLSCERKECALGPTTWLASLYFPIIWRFIAIVGQ